MCNLDFFFVSRRDSNPERAASVKKGAGRARKLICTLCANQFLLLSRDYEKDTFAFFTEGFELPQNQNFNYKI